MRDLSPEMIAAIEAKTVIPAFFVRLEFDTGTVRTWSGPGEWKWDDNDDGIEETYTGVGTLGKISDIEESSSIVANGIELMLSGVPAAAVGLALTEKYRGRKLHIWQAFFDTVSNDMIDFPEKVFAGRMDQMTHVLGGDAATLSVSCESRLVDLDRPREKRYTDQEQRQRDPADGSMRYTASLPDKEFAWGQKTDGVTSGGSGNTSGGRFSLE